MGRACRVKIGKDDLLSCVGLKNDAVRGGFVDPQL